MIGRNDPQQIPAVRRAAWAMWRAGGGHGEAPRPEDAASNYWMCVLQAQGLTSLNVHSIRYEAETLALPASTLGREGHTLVDLRHAIALLRVGFDKPEARKIARAVLTNLNPAEKETVRKRAERLIDRAFSMSSVPR
jgi:hypothetical protein